MSSGLEIGTDRLDGMIAMRLGGPSRVLQSSTAGLFDFDQLFLSLTKILYSLSLSVTTGSSLVLEMSIFPPRNEQNDDEKPLDSFGDRKDEVTILTVSKNEICSLFVGIQVNQIDLLFKLSKDLIEVSSKKDQNELFISSSSSSNSPSLIGSWLDNVRLEEIIQVLERSLVNAKSPLYKSVIASTLPTMITLFSDLGVNLNYFHIPANCTLPPRQHASGSLLYIYIPFFP